MANAELLVAHRGSSHVLPELWAQSNQAQYGADNYVFPFANNFGYTIVDNTHVTVKKGIAMIQGRPAILQADVTLVIENGATNYFRKDLICMRLDRTNGIENANVVVIKGTPVLSGAVDPTYNVGDFNTTVNIVDYPLLRVNVSGLVIGTVDTLFTVKTTIDSLKALIDTKQDSMFKGTLSSGNLNTVTVPGTYYVSVTTLGNLPIASNGELIVSAHSTVGNEMLQHFITGGTNPRIFERIIGKNWVELITTQSKKCGTFTNKKGQGDSLFLLFTLAELRTLFGVGTEKTQANFVVTGLTNVNSTQTGNVFSGAVWVTTNLYVQMSATLGSGAPLTVGYEITMC